MTSCSTRRISAVLVALMGLVNIVSAIYPAIPGRVELLQDVLSFHVIRGSQTATVLAGFFLILLADGLRKRRQRALQLTVALLLISSVLHLAKGLDFEEAILTCGLAAWLIAQRGAFDVRSRALTPNRVLSHLGEAIVLYWGYVLLGFFVLHRGVRPAPTLLSALSEPFHLLVGMPQFLYITPHAKWFENSLTVVACLFAIYVMALALRPFIPLAAATASDVMRARRLVERYGDDTLSYFSLQDGRSYFFDGSGESFLSYRLWGNVARGGGVTVGPARRLTGVIAAFLEFCEAAGMQPCFLGVAGESEGIYRQAGLRTLKIGEEALIELRSFDQAALKRKVRRAVRHIGELGIRAETYSARDLPEGMREQAEEISRAWMGIKGGSERGFSMTLGRLPRDEDGDCEVTVALQGERVLGFLSVVPVYGRAGWSLDAMRRLPDSPNGLMEFLVITIAERYRDRGYRTLSLNFASLANTIDDIDSRMLDGTRRFLFENLSGFYQLKSLAQFNGKFCPVWRSRYLAYGDVLTFPKFVLAVVQAEDPIKLPRVVPGRR